MKKENRLVKEAERNLINNARAIDDLFMMIDGFARFGNKFFPRYSTHGKKMFYKALSDMKTALRIRQGEILSQALVFSDVGGEETKKYSKEKFNDWFGEDKSVIHLLDEHLDLPSNWKEDTEKEFRKELERAKDE